MQDNGNAKDPDGTGCKMDYTVRVKGESKWYTMHNYKELTVIRHAKRQADMIGSTEFTITIGDKDSTDMFGRWKRINGIWKRTE